jgi:hypothetical protein
MPCLPASQGEAARHRLISRLCSTRPSRRGSGSVRCKKAETGERAWRSVADTINPGPTNIRNRVLRAMDRRAIDFNGDPRFRLPLL